MTTIETRDFFVLAGSFERDREAAVRSLDELSDLVGAADGDEVGRLLVRRDRPSADTYLGSGQVQELRDLVQDSRADAVVFDADLTPGQAAHVSDVVQVDVIDRTALILEIFARHVRSQEAGARAAGPLARAQVELAELEYALPRLRGRSGRLSQQSGRRGTRQGGGESELELDRRRIRVRINQLRRELAQATRTSATQSAARRGLPVPSVALVGRTNAGKSSLLRALTGSEVFVSGTLFATLESTTRRARTPDGRVVTLSDTVGFVRDLPHQLVEAFRSTLGEVRNADLLVHVVDASDPHWEEHVHAVRTVLDDIGARDVPELLVANKSDVASATVLNDLRRVGALAVSARTGAGLTEMLTAVGARLPDLVEVDTVVPFDQGDLVSAVHDDGEIVTEEYTPEGTHLVARVRPSLAHALTT